MMKKKSSINKVYESQSKSLTKSTIGHRTMTYGNK